MNIPEPFKKKIIGAFGEKGCKWLETLEEQVTIYLDKWELINLGPVDNLSYNYVLKVKDKHGNPFMLKAGVPSFDFNNEVLAVKTYGGDGCASIIKAEPEQGMILLEQLSPGKMLHELADEREVLEQYVQVWKALRRPAPINSTMPTIEDWAQGIKRYKENPEFINGPISAEYIELAEKCYTELFETSAGAELLHGDLHHENILFSDERGWTAIDPKGVIGDPYFDLIAFLYNHIHEKADPIGLLEYRIDVLVEKLDLNKERLLKAAFAMTILSVCWCIEDNDPYWEETYLIAGWIYDLLNK